MGSINCLLDTAFEQMMDTKVTFGKTDKRQGYHIIISFAPGEATEEQALDIVARFAQEYLKDKYEAVYAVHNDKKHMHGHIVFNSVISFAQFFCSRYHIPNNKFSTFFQNSLHLPKRLFRLNKMVQ